ncbi:hypothetical protein [Brochothrix phage ADU4]|nr:hypothetical protein [Brochothrix phage ADU4]
MNQFITTFNNEITPKIIEDKEFTICECYYYQRH